MNEDQLREERDRLRRELNELNRIVEPLLQRRDLLARRASALTELLRPVEEPLIELAEAQAWVRRLPDGGRRWGAERSGPDVVYATGPSRNVVWTEVKAMPTADGADASTIIADLLAKADRPLHREEIYRRSFVHPNGPLNRATMTTRLSRDSQFLKINDPNHAGYWALDRWPASKKKVPADPVGRRFATALRNIEFATQELEDARRRLPQLEAAFRDARIRAADRDASDSVRNEAINLAEQYDLEHDREAMAVRRLEHTHNLAKRLARELGAEAAEYQPIPPIDPAVATRSRRSRSQSVGTTGRSSAKGGDRPG